MQKLIIDPTRHTPEICFSPEEKMFIIRGNSAPEDVRGLYYPVIEWFKKFGDEVLVNSPFTPENPLIFKVDLDYFNSSSAKFLFDLLTELKRLIVSGIPVVVQWYYADDDIDLKEAGADMSAYAGIKFAFISKKA